MLDKTYDLWEATRVANPGPPRGAAGATKSDAMTASTDMHDDIVKACPNLKSLGF